VGLGWGGGAGGLFGETASTIRDGLQTGRRYALSGAEGWNEPPIPGWFGWKRNGGLGRFPRGVGAKACHIRIFVSRPLASQIGRARGVSAPVDSSPAPA
jgi:hypothetical protein